MSTSIPLTASEEIEYPDSDGQPMADNTKQFEYIVTIKTNLDVVYQHDLNVFVAGDLLWYPVQGNNKIRMAPDTMVVFGRPKGYRGSYRQWEEGGIAPQVVFEVLSPGNRAGKIALKFKFYERHGVEEYYLYDPDDGELTGWLRSNGELEEIPDMNGWNSPRLGVRFELVAGELVLYRPDGRKFATFVELEQQREEEKQRADLERQAREQAQQRAEQEKQRAEQEKQRAERLAAQLRSLGAEPET